MDPKDEQLARYRAIASVAFAAMLTIIKDGATVDTQAVARDAYNLMGDLEEGEGQRARHHIKDELARMKSIGLVA